jgi:hypothetical protein
MTNQTLFSFLQALKARPDLKSQVAPSALQNFILYRLPGVWLRQPPGLSQVATSWLETQGAGLIAIKLS